MRGRRRTAAEGGEKIVRLRTRTTQQGRKILAKQASKKNATASSHQGASPALREIVNTIDIVEERHPNLTHARPRRQRWCDSYKLRTPCASLEGRRSAAAANRGPLCSFFV